MGRALLLKRLLLAIPTLFGVAVVVFVLIRIVPGDPIAMMLPPGASEQDIANLRALYGLDRSIAEQFWLWLGGILRGDFGASITTRQEVLGTILARLPATLELAFAAILLAVGLGTSLALAGERWAGSWVEAAVDGFAALVLSIPDFLWALLFILLFGVAFAVLPISGRVDPRLEVEFSTQFLILEALLRLRLDILGSLLLHLILPAAALALPLSAIIARVLKTSLRQAMAQDYVLLARAKGFGGWRIVIGEALRNAAIPTLALTGVQFTFLVGGTVLIEKIFSYPGIGNLAIDAVINRDLPVIQGVVLAFAVLFILVNLLVDLVVTFLNPRLRHG